MNTVGCTFTSGNLELDRAFKIAMGDTLGNVAFYKSGLLTKRAPCLMAGLGYLDPWTRDAAINTWNGAGILIPDIMRNTLLSTLDTIDGRIRIIGQYWDAIIWCTSAWAYFTHSGDREFLAVAFEATQNSLRYFEQTEFDSATGLFRGASCFNDGVSGYTDIYADQPDTCILGWPGAHPDKRHPTGEGIPIQALSTNCLYANAYRIIEYMAKELDCAVDPLWKQKWDNMKTAINKQLWDNGSGRFRYYNDPWGGCSSYESLGNSFLLLFGLTDSERAHKVIASQPHTPSGVPGIWPEFERYAQASAGPFSAPEGRDDVAAENVVLKNDPRSCAKHGRHCGVVWPFISGFWAEAVLKYGYESIFHDEMNLLAHHICTAIHSPEIVHPDSGLPYGGMQESMDRAPIVRWASAYRQTWTATAYIRMALHGIFGFEFMPNGLTLSPCVPHNLSCVRLEAVPYRSAMLSIEVTGHGKTIDTVLIDGQRVKTPFLSSKLSGEHTICIRLK